MKKLLSMFFLLMFLCFPIKTKAVVTNSSYSVKVYFFFKEDCRECEEAQKWLEEYSKNSFINVEYLNSEENNDLYKNIKETLKIKSKKEPLIVIGSNFFIGFNDKIKTKLTDAITAYEKEENHCDTVSKIRKNENGRDCIKENKGIYKEPNHIFGKIVLAIFGIGLIIGIAFLLKNKKLLSRLHR